ncbi:cytochrome c class I [Shewanella halifaxensis HAW-EB4]|uniref:Cytochrome c class I n=1 Tax=Shewanella halifaxensis (strain HAW-EB4) TaxID=458817 RepID=B0TIQ4_SHEHH|nr:cytochrome c [Shewanella halifaxensis]ABZ75599.1 cytochrome c class I [Shewanella halifaxensis HAW-EB4]
MLNHYSKSVLAASLSLLVSASVSAQVTDTSFKDTLAVSELKLEAKILNYKADSSKGETLANQRCIACHGDAMLGMMKTYPDLKGQKAAYLFKQLVDFKRGDRTDPLMQGQAGMLSETEMKDIAYYYSTQTASDLSQ